MDDSWASVDGVAVDLATLDLERCGEVQPLFVAYHGDEQRFFAFLRPFEKGAYADPLIELLSLAMPLDADRLAFSITGRLTSMDDPIPPVAPGVDLRQRALVIEYADGATGHLEQYSVLHPFTLDGGRATWQAPVRLTDGQGWIRGALGVAVTRRSELARVAVPEDVRTQARRCAALGHELYLSEAVCARYELEGERAERPSR